MKKILLYPWGDYYLNNKIFYDKNFYNLCTVEKNPILLLKEELKSLNYDLITIDNGNLDEAEYIIFFEVPSKNNTYYRECIKKKLYHKMILFLWEPPVVNPKNYDKIIHENFTYIFTWRDDLVDNKKYFKFYYPQPSSVPEIVNVQFEKKKFCTLIAGNKISKVKGELYSERIKAIEYFEKNNIKSFDLFGRGWNKPRNRKEKIFPFLVRNFKSYSGETNNKLYTLSQYKFCICYENQSNVQGYVTEKIFDCFFAGCIPVYLGAENINDYIPENCFIDKRYFDSYTDLYNYLTSIGKKDYIEYQNNIKNYLEGSNFKFFTDEYFAKNITETIKNLK
ncbi:glycosyltransferase family 10 [Thermoanaerobacterium sp. RBIITD]|uniref:glycosyltransferase family 10 domain-containing protein n=1 Tax=Thermoanaerobacterium sp. RBIITD TaxID=1550240 RepID=UPI000BB9A20B|nr:glycosyltransferase family 10 [Thermoanaerobacterium sp. RBIITD]SNX52917.1 Glycosyltransferase family 10 (fucosyltransferase) C-term [Thermoanaerobacterium sp. RBIITD]